MQKYEREIEELLERLETEAGSAPPRPIRRDQRAPHLPRRRRKSVVSSLRTFIARNAPNPSQMMLAGIAIIFFAWILPLGPLEQWARLFGALLFLGAIVLNLLGANRFGREEKTWRGRPVEPDPPSWGDMKARMQDSARDFKRRFRRRY
ncbi:MAG: hypothetical protein M3Q29_16225 [Chloroflexota bacterium]|nr:hypothetical protein [Chloroflexota bacterium]